MSGTLGIIINNIGNLTLESCIFSDNLSTVSSGGQGAISNSGILNVLGCTFYNNRVTMGTGAAIFQRSESGNPELFIAGNLFFWNNSIHNNSANPVIHRVNGTVTSLGYNVVDVPIGIVNGQSGWIAGIGDKSISASFSALPVLPPSFKLLSESAAANVITELPNNYPTVDFYGNTITQGAAAGAVQSTVGSGFLIELTYDSARGSVDVSSTPDADGLYSGTVTLTATPESGFIIYWLVNEEEKTGNQIILTTQTRVQTVFVREWLVTNYTDQTSTPPEGTLRHALTNADHGDIIRIAASGQTISLASRLEVSRNVIIEGNGVTITRLSSMTSSTASQLMNVDTNITATIRRVHFRGGRSSDNGSAIRNQGNLTLESCIFNDNQTVGSMSSFGGAIRNMSRGNLFVLGCIFINNRAGTSLTSYGGAIEQFDTMTTLTLAGNLFFGNVTGGSNPNGTPIIRGGVVISLGYNVVNVPFGTAFGQSGWVAGTRDVTLADIGLPINLSPYYSDFTFTPSAGSVLRNHIPANHGIPGFPTVDFYGNTRTWPGAPGAVR